MTADHSPLEELTLRQLRRRAAELAISRYSRMTKEQLIAAVRKAQASRINLSHPSMPSPQTRDKVVSTKFHTGGVEDQGQLAEVDESLGDLPDGYGESRIMLLPRDPQWAYAYWDIPNEHKERLRQQGGQQLSLRLYDVTDLDPTSTDLDPNESVQEYPCDELAREWYLPIPLSDRSYLVEIGYRTAEGDWLKLARSASVLVPPTYPSDWIEDHFLTVPADQGLQGKTLYQLEEPPRSTLAAGIGVVAYRGTELQGQAGSAGLLRLADSVRTIGAVFGSQHLVSPYGTSSDCGWFAGSSELEAVRSSKLEAVAAMSKTNTPSDQTSRWVTPSSSATDAVWLTAEAELIIYGTTDPQAILTISGERVPVQSDGTFQYRLAFPNGQVHHPIDITTTIQAQHRTLRMVVARKTAEIELDTSDLSREDVMEELLP